MLKKNAKGRPNDDDRRAMSVCECVCGVMWRNNENQFICFGERIKENIIKWVNFSSGQSLSKIPAC